MRQVEKETAQLWSNKKRWVDELDLTNQFDSLSKTTEELSKVVVVKLVPRIKLIYSYWSSPEVKLLFCPLKGGVSACLVQRKEMLSRLILDNDSLLVLVDNSNRIIDISNKQWGCLRIKYIYIPKSYEQALQHMNNIT